MVETKRKRIRKQLDVKGSGSALGDTKVFYEKFEDPGPITPVTIINTE